MTRPADIPQWAWDEAENVASSLFGNYGSSEDLPPIARALLAAYERGRGEQREVDAKLADEIADRTLAQEAWDPDDDEFCTEAYEEAEYAASVASSVAFAIRGAT